jgi:uncharacterized protein YndB with AHSA1/START domain
MRRKLGLVTLGLGLAALTLAGLGCQRDAFDWDQPENLKVTEATERRDDGSVEMRFISLVNAPAEDLFDALSDVEHHAEFIEGVTKSTLVSKDGPKKIVEIQNNVLGRPNRAKIEWTFDRDDLTASFRTLEAAMTDNSAEYQVTPSPDGKRARVTTVYLLRDKGGHPFPLHSLQTAIEESYEAALRGVKRRALGPSKVVEH